MTQTAPEVDDSDRQQSIDTTPAGKPPKAAAKTPEQALAETEGPGNRKGKKRQAEGAPA
jgi:hypothetical protein